MITNDDSMMRIAVHEAGHCVIAMLLRPNDNIEVSLTERSKTLDSFDSEHKCMTKTSEENFIAEMIGGLVAEDLIYGEHSTGASLDAMKAAGEVRNLISLYGFYGYKYLRHFGTGEGVESSEKMLNEIDDLVESIFKRLEKFALKLIEKNKPLLSAVFKELVSKLFLSKKELEQIYCDCEKKYGIYTVDDYYREKSSEEH